MIEAMNQAWRRVVQIDDLERGTHRLNPEKVDRYARLLGLGEVPPPIRIAGNTVRDGHHRIAAAERMGRTTIQAVG